MSSEQSGAKPRIKEVIVVEGIYDKKRVLEAVHALVFETRGFALFKNRKMLNMLRLLAKERGLIIFTDSDRAGFLIRGFINSGIPKEYIKHAYIPSIPGKEQRKARPSRAGLIGVEGAGCDVIRRALLCAGSSQIENDAQITKLDFFNDGLCGKAQSAVLRRRLAARLGLPERLSANALLGAVNAICTREEYEKHISEIKENGQI